MAVISTFFQNLPDDATCLLFILCFCFAIFWYTWMYKSSRKESSPPLPPGPRGLPLVGSLPFLDPELHTYFANLAETYGPIVKLRLGNKIGIVINSPSCAREVLKDQDVVFANHDVPIVARETTNGGRDIVWTPYGPEWRMLRKICVMKMLSNTSLDSVYTLRRREVRETVRYFYSRVGSAVNLGEHMALTTLNVVIKMLWGSSIQGEEGSKMSEEFRKAVTDFTDILGKPNVSDFFPSLAWLDLQGLAKKAKVLGQKFDEIYRRVIDQKLKSVEGGEKKIGDRAKDCKDFLQFLLQLKDEEDSKIPLTMTHVKGLLTDMVSGGSDTTSNALIFAMAELINNPEIMKKLREELDEVVGKDKVVEEPQIHMLPYLNAVMKETLRLHPTLPLLVPHCPSETCVVGGYTIPKGARIFLNVWAIHRDPSIWENPLEFYPERFMNNKWDYNGSNFNYFPFGSGRRICAGIAMAERMFLHSLATFVHSFDWKLPEGEKLDIIGKFGIVMKLKNSLLAIPTPRLSDPALYE